MKVFLVPNTTKKQALLVAAQAARILLDAGAGVILEEGIAGNAPVDEAVECLPAQAAFEACDIVATIGGDGTILHAARNTMHCQKPLIGINIGNLGFLTIVEQNELEKLSRLVQGEYTVEHRSLLKASVRGKEIGYALNDVLLFKTRPDRAIALDIYCDDIKVSGFRGDGMIFATPTGSTAYSMSAGGPIVDARLGGIVATQVCAHVIHAPPMVFAANRTLRAVPQGAEDICLSCDGQGSIVLPQGAEIFICQAQKTVPIVEFYDAGQLTSIDKKLKGR